MRDLTGLNIGEEGRVAWVTARGGMRRRLMDLGLTPGARVRCLLAAPGGGMRAYGVRGTVVALRIKDAETVLLEDGRHG